MDEILRAAAAAIPQGILLGIVLGALVYTMRGSDAFTAMAQFVLGLTIGFIVGCLFNLTQVIRVWEAMQTSVAAEGGTLSFGLTPDALQIFIQRILIFAGLGGAIGLLWAEPGAMANGAFVGGIMGLIGGIIVGVGMELLDMQLTSLYRLGIIALVIIALLTVASLQGDQRRIAP